MSYVIISKWESFKKKNLKVGLSGRWGGRTPVGRVSGRGEGGHWSSWWDWSPGSNSLRRQDWSKRRNVLTGTDVKCQDKERFFFYSQQLCSLFSQKFIKTSRNGRMRAWCKSDALTLVKVELLVGRGVPQTFDVHKVAVDVWIIQRTESHVCNRKEVSPSGLTLNYFRVSCPTCCLLFLDGHG